MRRSRSLSVISESLQFPIGIRPPLLRQLEMRVCAMSDWRDHQGLTHAGLDEQPLLPSMSRQSNKSRARACLPAGRSLLAKAARGARLPMPDCDRMMFRCHLWAIPVLARHGLELQEARQLRVWVAALRQPSVLPASQIIHQAHIVGAAMRFRPRRDTTVQEAGLRQSCFSMEVGENRVCGRLC